MLCAVITLLYSGMLAYRT